MPQLWTIWTSSGRPVGQVQRSREHNLEPAFSPVGGSGGEPALLDDRDRVPGGDGAALGHVQLLTGPPTGAGISVFIFIALNTATRAPSFTSAPFSTATFNTVPWIGEISSPAAPPPPPPARSLRLGAFRGAAPAPAGPAPFGAPAAPITFTSKRRPGTSTA